VLVDRPDRAAACRARSVVMTKASVRHLVFFCCFSGLDVDPVPMGSVHVLIELYADMDVFIPKLGMCEARPWHEHFPMKPKSWKLSELNTWGAEYVFNLAQV
jgi:hypothetical protein